MKHTSEFRSGANLLKGGLVWLLAVILLALTPLSAFAATTAKSYTFTGNSESWAGVTLAESTATYSANTLTTTITGRNKSNVGIGWQLTGVTWEDLGVPPGDVVTAVDGAFDWQCSTYTVGASSSSGALTITDNADGNATTLETEVPFTSTTTLATRNASGAIAVPAAMQASNSSIKVKLLGTLATANNTSATVTRVSDSVTLTITHAPPAPSNSYGTMTSMSGPLTANLSQQTVATVPVTLVNGGATVSSYTVNLSGTVTAGDVAGVYVNDGTSTWSATGSYGNGSSVVTSGANAIPGATLSIRVTLNATADTKTVAVTLQTDANAATSLPQGPSNALSITVPAGPNYQITTCDGCHGNPPVDGARSGATGLFVGSHNKHNYACNFCHSATLPVAFSHRDGTIDFRSGTIGKDDGTDDGVYNGGGAAVTQTNTPVTTSDTCSNVNCHGNLITPRWGVETTTCSSCHALPPNTNAHTKHYTSKGWTTGVTTDCIQCHPNNTSTHSTVDGLVTVNAGLSPTGSNQAITCNVTGTGCHNGKPTPVWNTTGITCTDCHTAGGAAAGDPTSGLHNVTPSVSGRKHDQTLHANGCTICHSQTLTAHWDQTVQGGAGQTVQMGLAAFYTQTANDTGTCATTTCHLGNSDAWAHKWMATANYTNVTAACTGCHGTDLSVTNLGVSGVDHLAVTAKHNVTATNYQCKDCHAIESASGYAFTFGSADWSNGGETTLHGNGQITMNDDVPGVGGNITGWQRGTGGNSSKSLCLKCHTNWTDSAPQHWAVNTGWTTQEVAGDAITSACGECHTGGVTPGSASGAHTLHNADPSALVDGGTACVPCHGDNGGLGFHNATAGTHGSGSVNFASVTYSTAVRNNVTGTCSTTNCHNRGTDQSTAWNSTALACDDCHYYSATPTAAGNTAHASPLSASHGNHFDGSKLCTQCHGADPVAGDTSHISGVTSLADKATALQDEATLNWTHASAVTDYTFTDVSNTCSSATNNGLGCHATGAPVWDTPFASTDCTNCHTDTATAAVNPTSGLHGVVPSVSGVQHDSSFGTGGTCSSCHSSIPAYSTHKNGTFTGNGSVAGDRTNMGLAAFYTNGGSDNTGTCATTTCHVGQSDAWAHVWNSTAGYYTTNTTACEGCHGDSSSGFNAGVTHRSRGPHTDGATYGCAVCHVLEAGTGNYTFTWNTNDWGGTSKHGNSTIEVNTNGTYNTTSNLCTACHNTTDGVHNFVDTGWTVANLLGDGISGGSCLGCHGATVNTSLGAITTDSAFPAGGSHAGNFSMGMKHISGTLTDAQCEVCHSTATQPMNTGSANRDKIQLKDPDGTGVIVIDQALAETDATRNNNTVLFCTGCHDADGSNDYTGASATIPFANGVTVKNIDQYYNSAITGKTHNYTYNTTPQLTKARSPHGKPTTNVMKNESARTNFAADTAPVGCQSCHPSHGGAALNPVPSISGGTDINSTIVDASMMLTGYSEPGSCWTCHNAAGVKDYYGDNTVGGNWTAVQNSAFTYKRRNYLSRHQVQLTAFTPTRANARTTADSTASVSCSVCHNPHGATTWVGTNGTVAYQSFSLRGNWMTSPYLEDRASQTSATTSALYADAPLGPRTSSEAAYNRPATLGHGYSAAGGSGWDGYFIDENTFGPPAKGYPTATIAQTMTEADTSFAGLCANCHATAVGATSGGSVTTMKGYLNGTLTTANADWSTSAKIHNTVKGWYNTANSVDRVNTTNNPTMRLLQSTYGSTVRVIQVNTSYSPRTEYAWGVNLTNGTKQAYHNFSCSKCHTPHASSLPRLMVSNCLDVGTGTTARPAKNASYNNAVNPQRYGYTFPTYGTFAGSGATTGSAVAQHCHNAQKTNTSGGLGWNQLTGW